MNQVRDVRLALCFKDFASWLMDTSSVGLNVAGYTTAQVLRDNGIHTTVFPVRHNADLVTAINKYNANHWRSLTHVVISAPWLSLFDMEAILKEFPDIQFVVLSHSNVGFLQADANGVELLRGYLQLQTKYWNIHVGGNSRRFAEWFTESYERKALWLPNLYPIMNAVPTKQYDNCTSPIKIGAFGAVRPYKNFMTAAAAALIIRREFNVPVEFHMSAGGEGDNGASRRAIMAMLKDTGVELISHGWMYWPDFIKLVGQMDLLIQVSYTESFNLITADGVLAGVPSVVSSAIRWAPKSWVADSDDVLDVAAKGVKLLLEEPSRLGIDSLEASNAVGLKQWQRFLGISKLHWFRKFKFWR